MSLIELQEKYHIKTNFLELNTKGSSQIFTRVKQYKDKINCLRPYYSLYI